jgi:hypothetical protein
LPFIVNFLPFGYYTHPYTVTIHAQKYRKSDLIFSQYAIHTELSPIKLLFTVFTQILNQYFQRREKKAESIET